MGNESPYSYSEDCRVNYAVQHHGPNMSCELILIQLFAYACEYVTSESRLVHIIII